MGTLQPRVNLWLEHDGQVAISLWRVALLEAVGRTGSISSAAEQMRVPYRVAWSKIRQMEDALGVALIETRTGGADGGGAVLTEAAERYVTSFRGLRGRLEAWVQEQLTDVLPETE